MSSEKYSSSFLTEDQLTVIQTLQAFYTEYQRHPSMRILISLLEREKKWGKDRANSIYLHQLFPEGPIKQASQLGGLPKPRSCI